MRPLNRRSVSTFVPELLQPLARWWWVLAIVLCPALYLSGSTAERLAVGAAALLAAAGIFDAGRRPATSRLALALLLAATASLAVHLLLDDFGLRHVWLYSAVNLPWYLKLANLWGGDESTLLFLATLTALFTPGMCRRGGWAAPGALVLLALFALGASVWSPFATTSPADAARLTSQGMNAHLMSPWMAFHPPQLFLAYVLLLAPAGAALQALTGRGGDWDRVAPIHLRAGWLVLSGGLAVGMWWAYEDITFAQIWHWDPVQTSVFVVWALASAQLHCLRKYRPRATFAILSPFLALLTGIAVLVSMAVTRTAMLASSHRYVGETSFLLYAAAAAVLGVLTLGALIHGWRAGARRKGARDESVILIRIAVIAFCAAAAIAFGHLAEAFAGAWLGLPRPDSLKPFFETLTRWSKPSELAELRRAFDQWDIYGFGVNRWLAPLAILFGLVGGHYFMPLHRRWRWAGLLCALAAVLAAALVWQPFETHFRGIGMTSGKTVAIFGWLDAAFAAGAYLLLAVTLWLVEAMRRHWGRPLIRRYYLPVGLIHTGIVIAIAAATTGTIFDSYAQKMVNYPEDFGQSLALPDGYSVTLALRDYGAVNDGGRGNDGSGGFYAVADASWSLKRGDNILERQSGHTLFRDARPPPQGGQGAVRLMCEILDYRYARYVDKSGRIMHPFIHRGLWRDVQVWFPSPEFKTGESGIAEPQPGRLPLVLKTYPMMTWLWVGLAMALAGAGVIFGYTLTDRRNRT
jgi:cytochrome c-type biogenesis protein CcmF